MGLNGQAGWACRDKALSRSSLLMLTKLLYTAFYTHVTHAMRWFLHLDVKWETEGKKRESGCMDSKKNKEVERWEGCGA